MFLQKNNISNLTEFGRTMIPMLEAIALWGRDLSSKEGQLMSKEAALVLVEGAKNKKLVF